MRRFLGLLAVGAVAGLFLACNPRTDTSAESKPAETGGEAEAGKRANAEASAAVENPSPRDTLVQDLITKGDKLTATDKEAARAAFKFARTFAAADKQSAIGKKLESLGPQAVSLSNTEIEAAQNAIYWTSSADYGNFSPRTDAMDVTNLKMLLDEGVVGNLRYTTANSSSGSFNFFLAPPKLTIAEIRQKYGAPSAARTDKDDSEVLTYGPLRMVGKKDGTVAVVLFSLP